MNLGGTLLMLAVASGFASLIATVAVLGGRDRPTPRAALASTVLTRFHAATALATLGVMLTHFLVSDVRFAYVWDHTHAAYPLAYKVAGLWGGQEGTILLWGSLVAAFSLMAFRGGGPTDRIASAFLTALSTSLLGIAIAGDAFRLTGATQLAFAPQGAGLADVLVTPLMVIHPPIQFAAYALMAVPAGYALAGWLLDEPRAWAGAAYRWARVGWLFATIGLGLGAIWAYYVLSFGGYWAWDPVETSNLLPWLALTAFLHAGKHHLRFGDHPLSAPVYAFAAFALTVFATFATRSGLWVSVHAFTDPTSRFEPDAAARLMGILEVHMPTRAFLALLTASVLIGIALFLHHHARTLEGAARNGALATSVGLFALGGWAGVDPRSAYGALFELAAHLPGGTATWTGILLALFTGGPLAFVYLAREHEGRPAKWDTRTLMTGAVVLFGVATVVAFLLNLEVVNGQDRSLFDARAPLMALPIIALVTTTLALPPLGRTRALLLSGTGLVAGVIAAILVVDARVVALSTPPLLAGLVATTLRLAHAQGRSAPKPLQWAGALLLVAGLLGFVLWANPPTLVNRIPIPRALTLPLGFAGIGLSTLAVLGGVACFRQRGRGLAFTGAVAGILALGYGLGAAAALAALLLILRTAAPFAPGRRFHHDEAARLRETGIYLIHFALIIGLLGYAASTYSQSGESFTGFQPGTTATLGDHTFAVAPALATPAAGGGFDRIDHEVTMYRGDSFLGTTTLSFVWEGTPNPTYKAHLDVERLLGSDVYLQPLALHTAEDGWVSEGATQRMQSADVDAITFRATVLPLMSLVWAGLWTMGIGMTLVLVATRAAPDTTPVYPTKRE